MPEIEEGSKPEVTPEQAVEPTAVQEAPEEQQPIESTTPGTVQPQPAPTVPEDQGASTQPTIEQTTQEPEIVEPFTAEQVEQLKTDNPLAKVQIEKVVDFLNATRKSLLGDYTRKTQGLAEKRKTMDSEQETYKGYKTKAEAFAQLETNPSVLAYLKQLATGDPKQLPSGQRAEAAVASLGGKLDLIKAAKKLHPDINPEALKWMEQYNDIFGEAINEVVKASVGNVSAQVEPITFERDIAFLEAKYGKDFIIKNATYREGKDAKGNTVLVPDPNGEGYGFEDDVKAIMARDKVTAKEAFWRIPEVRNYYETQTSKWRNKALTADRPQPAPRPTAKTVVLGGNAPGTPAKQYTPQELDNMPADQFAKVTGLTRVTPPKELGGTR